MTRSSTVQQHWLVAAIGAGLVSGVTLAAFAAFADSRAGVPVSTTYTFLAASIGGSTFADGPAAVPVGIVVLFGGTILWACGYLYAAQRQAQLLTRPLLSGAGFGVIVWFVMQVVLVGSGHFTAPTIYTFDRDMVAFILFFGVPLAFTASRLTRAR